MRLTSESVLHYTCIKSGENVDIFCDQCFDGKRFCRWFPFRFYNAICPFQASISSDDDVISREFASLRAHAPAGDSQSLDSGIDLRQSVRASKANGDSDTGLLPGSVRASTANGNSDAGLQQSVRVSKANGDSDAGLQQSVRLSTASVDSDAGLQASVRLSTASVDSDTGSRSSMLSQDSTVTCDVTAAALAAAVPVKVEVSGELSAEAAATNVDDVKPTVDLASACSTDV